MARLVSDTRAAAAKQRSSAASLPPSARMSSKVLASPHHPLSGREIGVRGALALGLERRLVKPGRQRVDQVDVARELAVLFLGDAAGHEDAEVADGLVDRVDDRLPVGADLVDALVQIENPSERLLRRRDVVAL